MCRFFSAAVFVVLPVLQVTVDPVGAVTIITDLFSPPPTLAFVFPIMKALLLSCYPDSGNGDRRCGFTCRIDVHSSGVRLGHRGEIPTDRIRCI